MESDYLAGRLLVATPQIGEGVFHRSVILMLHHDADGAQGVVLNRPMEAPVDAVLPAWQEHVTPPGVLFEGGPVGLDTALGLVTVPGGGEEPLGVKRLFGGVGLVDLDTPPVLVLPEIAGLRIYAGYAGWSPGQLEDRWARAAGTSWTPRPVTRSRTTPTTCGSGCCVASATTWPSSRPSLRTRR